MCSAFSYRDTRTSLGFGVQNILAEFFFFFFGKIRIKRNGIKTDNLTSFLSFFVP
jgi:hypothetical protein